MKKLLFAWFLLPLSLFSLVLQEEVWRDLSYVDLGHIGVKPKENKMLDVAIIGGGQAGLTLCFALKKRGIFQVTVFDAAEKSLEGPWRTTARMLTLRSVKEIPGPSLNIPHLSFQAWYEAEFGDWDKLYKIPPSIWAEYLSWYREVLMLPVKNGWHLQSIEPKEDHLELLFNEGRKILARKVVLATGRNGCGTFNIPSFMQNVPKSFWFHTGEEIETSIFQGKTICIVGSGDSAYDIAGTALEAGAEQVLMLMQRKKSPQTNPWICTRHWPAFYFLSDAEKAHFFQCSWNAGVAVPKESVDRVLRWDNFHLFLDTHVESISLEDTPIVHSNKGCFKADLLLLATGYRIDVASVPELVPFATQILLWGDRLEDLSSKLASFPYLGPHFEFLEKVPGSAPFLKNIHCFNYGAFLSHGRLSGEIDRLPEGIERIADGIECELFLKAFGTR